MIFKNDKTNYNNYITSVDNAFISDYLPSAPENAVKVYLYGLYLCGITTDELNTMDSICDELSLSPEEVLSALDFWAETGAIEIRNRNPLEITFLPLSFGRRPQRKFNKTKYADFNEELISLFPTRDILPAEYNEYYTFIEDNKIQPEVLLLIINFCVKMQGSKVKAPYVLTVANDWVKNQRLNTIEKIDEKLKEFDTVTSSLKDVCFAMQKKNDISFEVRSLYIKWTTDYKFTKEGIIFAVENFKIQNFSRLDAILTELNSLGITTIEDIQEYKIRKDTLYNTAKTIAKRLGKYLERYDYVIENYVSVWFDYGYSQEAILLIAHNAALKNVNSFENLHFEIENLYNSGIISDNAVMNYYDELTEDGRKAQNVLTATGVKRRINSAELNSFNIWTKQWGFSYEDLILIAHLALGKSHTFSFLTNLLAKCNEANAKDADAVENYYKATYAIKTQDKVERNLPESDIRSRLKEIYNSDIEGDVF